MPALDARRLWRAESHPPKFRARLSWVDWGVLPLVSVRILHRRSDLGLENRYYDQRVVLELNQGKQAGTMEWQPKTPEESNAKAMRRESFESKFEFPSKLT
jgi:hypothetical protein